MLPWPSWYLSRPSKGTRPASFARISTMRTGSGTELNCSHSSAIQSASRERFRRSCFQWSRRLTTRGLPTNPLAWK
nr:hypothetical protein [Corallococcus sp. CA053C]